MDEPRLGRRSLLRTTGALAGAGALGLLGGDRAAAAGEPARATGRTQPGYDRGDPEEFYVEVELTFENAEGETVTETPTLYGAIVRPLDGGQTATYSAETPGTPGASDEDVFGPAEYSDAGDLWAAADGTDRAVYVVGIPT